MHKVENIRVSRYLNDNILRLYLHKNALLFSYLEFGFFRFRKLIERSSAEQNDIITM